MPIEHKDIPDTNLHEAKGASGASDGSFLRGNGDGTATFQALNDLNGWWNYDDATTSGTPIALTAADTRYTLTNDALGGNNDTTYGLTGVDIWNSSTNRFDFSNLAVGDMYMIRADVVINNSGANGLFTLDLELGEGSGSSFFLPMNQLYVKSAGSVRWITTYMGFVGSSLTKDNPARITMQSDTTGDTVEVNGWYVTAHKKSLGA